MTKTAKQIAHEQRNAERKAAAVAAKADRIDAHRRHNLDAAVDAIARRQQRIAAHNARNEETKAAAAAKAYAEAVGDETSFAMNDNEFIDPAVVLAAIAA